MPPQAGTHAYYSLEGPPCDSFHLIAINLIFPSELGCCHSSVHFLQLLTQNGVFATENHFSPDGGRAANAKALHLPELTVLLSHLPQRFLPDVRPSDNQNFGMQ